MDTVHDDGGSRRPEVEIPTVRDSETDPVPGQSTPWRRCSHLCPVLGEEGRGGRWKEQKPKKEKRRTKKKKNKIGVADER